MGEKKKKKKITGKRAGAQGALLGPLEGAHEPVVVPSEGPGVREQPVRPAHGLRRLQVRVPRHEDVHLGERAGGAHAHKVPDQGQERVRLAGEPQAHVRRHLVVSRPPCGETERK
jgi:hypothetical protein